MAAKSSLKNMLLCLSAVCLACGSVLAAVYAVTYDPIEQTAKKATVAAIAQVLPQGDEISEVKSVSFNGKSFDYYTLTKDGEVVAYAVKSVSDGFGGPLELMVGVCKDLSIYSTKVLSHSETPGLGAKCTTDTAFMSQWNGFKGVFKVKKDGGDVDAITASTITSRAYTKAVEQAALIVAELQK